MIEVYTDGASKGNPGPSGAGIYIRVNKNKYEYSLPLGVLSNHEAEFHAVIHALTICERDFPNEILSFHTDSQLVANAVENKYVKNNQYKTLLEKVLEQSGNFPYFFIKWLPAKQNKADILAKKAIHLN